MDFITRTELVTELKAEIARMNRDIALARTIDSKAARAIVDFYTAKVSEMQTLLAHLEAQTVGMAAYSVTQGRRAYRSTAGADGRAYLFQQGLLYGAARAAGLDTKDDAARHNATRAFFGDSAITSWTQLTPSEMREMREAIEDGYFVAGWEVSPFAARCAERARIAA